MNKVLIRQATMQDAPVIHQFVNELEDILFEPELFYNCYRHNLLTQHTHYLVAVLDDKVLGYISCHGQILLHHGGLVYEIQELFVDKEHRNKKIGAMLLKALEEKLAREDYKLLEVASGFKRTDTHRFYLSNGFNQTHFKFTKEQGK